MTGKQRPGGVVVRRPGAADAGAVTTIHAQGLATGHASFREEPYTWTQWQEAYGSPCPLVAERDGTVLGWAGVTPASARAVYRGVGEVSIYVASAAAGQGIGHALLAGLVACSEAAGFWTLFGHIFPENGASLTLHARHGFEALCVRRRLGRMSYGPMAGCWRDVVLMERRSPTVGREAP